MEIGFKRIYPFYREVWHHQGMLDWSIEPLQLSLRFPWKIARSTTFSKKNFIVMVVADGIEGKGEVAFNTRYNESEKTITNGFEKFINAGAKKLSSREDLSDLLKQLKLDASLSFGIESAFTHFSARQKNQKTHEFLKIPILRGAVATSFSLPIMPPGEVQAFITKHKLTRFPALKLKLSAQGGFEFIKEVSRFYRGAIRLDANEAFDNPDAYMRLCESLKDLPIQFIEQPFPAQAVEIYRSVKKCSPLPIFADESLTDNELSCEYKELFHGVNVKLMKAGGYRRALEQLEAARMLGLSTMLGCMVETSLGIASAMNLASKVDFCDLDGFLLINNDPFDAIYERKGILGYSERKLTFLP